MTMQAQHTPGPLTADATVPRGGQKPTRYLFSKTNVVVAEVGGPCRCYSKRTQKANAERLALAWNCHDDLVAALKRILGWLEQEDNRASEAGKDARFPSLAEAYAADAKNYRAMASDIKAALAKAEPEC